jgi:hypothetical protein
VDFSIIEGGSPESPINIANLATFGALDFTVTCAPDNCLAADPLGTISALTLDYSYKGSTSPVAEPAGWWLVPLGLAAMVFGRRIARQPEPATCLLTRAAQKRDSMFTEP